jgi:hypothetical protein
VPVTYLLMSVVSDRGVFWVHFSILITIFFSYFVHKHLELPMIRMGNKLAARIGS